MADGGMGWGCQLFHMFFPELTGSNLAGADCPNTWGVAPSWGSLRPSCVRIPHLQQTSAPYTPPFLSFTFKLLSLHIPILADSPEHRPRVSEPFLPAGTQMSDFLQSRADEVPHNSHSPISGCVLLTPSLSSTVTLMSDVLKGIKKDIAKACVPRWSLYCISVGSIYSLLSPPHHRENPKNFLEKSQGCRLAPLPGIQHLPHLCFLPPATLQACAFLLKAHLCALPWSPSPAFTAEYPSLSWAISLSRSTRAFPLLSLF